MNNRFGQAGTGSFTADWKHNKYPSYTQLFYGTLAEVNYSGSIYWNKGWDVNIVQGNPCVLTATVNVELQSGGDGITPVTVAGTFVTCNWSFHYNTAEKELLEVNTNVIPWINQIATVDKTRIESLLSNTPSGSIDWGTGSANYFSGSTSASVAACQVVYTMLKNGMKTVPIIQPILRQQLVVPNGWDLTTCGSNLERIYAKASVQSEIGVPSNFYAVMPQDSPDINYYTDSGTAIPCLYGWQKQPPTIDQNGTTMTITQEWNYGLWFQNIYGTRL